MQKTNRKFFNTISKDPAVSSVGISKSPKTPPVFLVDSSRFAERSGLWEAQVEPLTRTSERTSDVILENANLTTADRVWRFLDVQTQVPFSAKMRDDDFVNDLSEGRIKENIRIGIEMTIQIKFKQEYNDGVWKDLPSTIEVMKVDLK